jgi:hypothetical protein
VEAGWFDEACSAFEAAGSALTKEDLTVICSKYLKEGWLDAHQAFKEVGSREDLLAVGRRNITRRRFDAARQVLGGVGPLGRTVAVGIFTT